MRRHSGCMMRSAVVGMWLIVLLFLVALIGTIAWLRQQQETARIQYLPPQVTISNPRPGTTVAAGSHAPVAATIHGGKPIVREELWVDGELKDYDAGLGSEPSMTVYGAFDWVVSPGPHLLYVRGIDTDGSIGQSVAVNVVGSKLPERIAYADPVKPGDTLATIAETYSTTVAAIVNANPDLGGNEPVAGSTIIVPTGSAPAPAPPAVPVSSASAAPVPVPGVSPLEMVDPLSEVFFGVTALLLPHRPSTPSDLQGQMNNCNIRLRWNDNANNETRNDVWVIGASGSPRVIAALKPGKGGAVWAELTAPEAGKLSIWVEAVNAIGGQPSNIISLTVEPKCAPPPTKLEIEALEITATAEHDRTYCYVSLEGMPEMRIPKEPNQFVKIGKGQSAGIPKQKFLAPIPANGVLDISGECWGWAGKTLDKLGGFSHKFAADTWDGKPQQMVEANFKIALTFTKQGEGDGTRVIYDLPEDSHIPAPFDLKMDSFRATGPIDPKLRGLHWKWNNGGDPKIKITSFSIFRYGYLIKQRTLSPAEQANPPLDWEEDIRLDYECGVDWEDHRTQWQVMAQTADAVSPLSVPHFYVQEPCDRYARIFFSSVLVNCWPQKNIHGGFSLTVNGETRSFWDDKIYTWIDCGKNTFISMIGSWSKMNTPQAFVVPLDIKGNPNGDVDTRVVIWNDDGDVIARMNKRYSLLPADDIVSKCGKDFTISGDVVDNRYATFDVNVRVYPNRCDTRPP